MSPEELVQSIGLTEGRHFSHRELALPVIDSHLYTSLGKELYELYEKYKMSSEDQRRLEALSFMLMAFVLERNKKPTMGLVQKLKKKIFS